VKDGASWCRILKEKYLGNMKYVYCIWDNDLPSRSRVWVNIIKNISLFREGVRWLVGEGSKVIFWEDSWLEGKPLVHSKFGVLRDSSVSDGK